MSEYDRAAVIDRFVPLVEALRRSDELQRAGVAVIDLDAPTLARTIGSLRDLQRTLCTTPEQGVRLPVDVFADTAINGGAHCILEAALLFKHARRWRTFGFDQPTRADAHRELLAAIRNALRDQQRFVEPRITFARTVPEVSVPRWRAAQPPRLVSDSRCVCRARRHTQRAVVVRGRLAAVCARSGWPRALAKKFGRAARPPTDTPPPVRRVKLPN